MALQSQSPGQVQEILGILKRRIWQILLPAALIYALGASVATLTPRKYKVGTKLELREIRLPLGGQGIDVGSIQRDVTNTKQHVTATERIRRVIDKLEWQDYTSLTPTEQQDYLQRVADGIGVAVTNAGRNGGSSFITLTYEDADPARAEQFITLLRDSYTSEVVERFRNGARDARDVLNNQRKVAEKLYRAKEADAATLKKEHGLSATQQAPGGGRQRDEDPVFVRLTQARNQLFAARTKLTQDTARMVTLTKQLEAEPHEIPEAQLLGGLDLSQDLQDIEDAIAEQELKKEGIRPAHSNYQQADFNIQKLRAQQEELLARTRDPDARFRMVANPARDTLRTDIAATQVAIEGAEAIIAQLDVDIRELAREHAELAEVWRKVRLAENEVTLAYDDFVGRTNAYSAQKAFVDLIADPMANPFEITQVARKPRTPSSPNEGVIRTGALLGGLAIGLAWALISEYGRAAYRGVADISRSLGVPVLGAVNVIVTRAEARRVRMRRALVGVSTALLVGSIFWVTWAYEKDPRSLGAGLTGFIDQVREQLR